jgi:hypothetical protein
LRKRHREALPLGLRKFRRASDRVDDERLRSHEPEREHHQQQRHLAREREIRFHSHRHEEEPEEKPLERLDVGLELVPELGIGEQQAGEECAERHRELEPLHDHRGGHDEQQRGGGEDLGAAVAGDELQSGTHDDASDDDECDDRRYCFYGDDPAVRGFFDSRVCEQREQREERNHHDVLEQEHREGFTSVVCADLPALRERSQDERRRRHGDAEARHERSLPREPQPRPGEPERKRGERDLRATEAEHQAAHAPEPRGLELEAHEKQQQRDTEFREAERFFGVGDDSEPPRAEHHARSEITQDRAELEALEERHEQDCAQQENGGDFEQVHGGKEVLSCEC